MPFIVTELFDGVLVNLDFLCVTSLISGEHFLRQHHRHGFIVLLLLISSACLVFFLVPALLMHLTLFSWVYFFFACFCLQLLGFVHLVGV